MREQHLELIGAMRSLHGPVAMDRPLLYLDPERYFTERARRWLEETRVISSVSEWKEHPAFQEIVAMGPVAIPLALRELMQGGAVRWAVVLRALNGSSPVAREDAGVAAKIRDAWSAWARERGVSV